MHLPWIWPYARLDGLAYRVVPSVDPEVWDVEHLRRQLLEKVRYAGLTDTRAPLDADSNALSRNYVAALIQLLQAQLARGEARACLDTLRFFEQRIPLDRYGEAGDQIRTFLQSARMQAESRLASPS